jgi:hypothetical protein
MKRLLFSFNILSDFMNLLMLKDTWQGLLCAGFTIPTIVTLIPLANNNLGFDPKGNIPICFYIVSQNPNYFRFVYASVLLCKCSLH